MITMAGLPTEVNGLAFEDVNMVERDNHLILKTAPILGDAGSIRLYSDDEQTLAGEIKADGSAVLGSLSLGGNKQPSTFLVEATINGAQAATAGNYGSFFIASVPCQVVSVHEVHAVAGTDTGTATLDVEKLAGTQAPGGGVSALAAGKVNLKGAANTVQNPALSATQANLQLAAGDRLNLLPAGTLTAVAGVCVQVEMKLI
jgi:hypothetical protein